MLSLVAPSLRDAIKVTCPRPAIELRLDATRLPDQRHFIIFIIFNITTRCKQFVTGIDHPLRSTFTLTCVPVLR